MLDDEEEDGTDSIQIPGFQSGGLVRETGIALVHEGEFIMPAPGSEAAIEPAQMSEQGEINYYFPIEIVVVGSLPEAEREVIEASIWEKLSEELDRLA
jgi:hypothetical protein